MKKYTIATFGTRTEAEEAINELHQQLSISPDEISYVYKDIEGVTKEVDADEVSGKTVQEGATEGATIGGGIGAIAGLATVAGIIPVIGPIFAAGPLITALGIGAGALGTVAAGGVTGAAAGGLIGALVSLGASEEQAKEYEDLVLAGNVLVTVHAEEDKDVALVFNKHGALSIDEYGVVA